MTRPKVWQRTAIQIAILLCLTACAQQTEVVKLYESEDASNRNFSRLLVVDESTNVNDRERFEEMLVEAVAAENTEAITSHSVVGFDVAVTDDVLRRAITESDADAVLITQIASVDMAISTREGRVNVEPTCRKGDFYDPFLYDYPETKEPDSISVTQTVVVIASLYDAMDDERLWTIQSTCFDKRSSMAFMADQSTTIAAQLKRDGLLK